MRKFALAGLTLVLSVGLGVAAQVTFLGYDKEKKELKVKDGDDEKRYQVTDKTVFKNAGKNGDKELSHADGLKALEELDKSDRAKGKAKLDVEADGTKLKEVKGRLSRGKRADK